MMSLGIRCISDQLSRIEGGLVGDPASEGHCLWLIRKNDVCFLTKSLKELWAGEGGLEICTLCFQENNENSD